MLFSKWTIIILFIILINYQVQPLALPIYWAVFNMMSSVVKKIGYSPETGESIKSFDSADTVVILKELLGKADQVTSKLDIMNEQIEGQLNKIDHLIEALNKESQENGLVNDLIEPMKQVSSKYYELHDYAMLDKVPIKRLNAFMEEITDSGKKGLHQDLKKIHKIITTGNRENEFLRMLTISANSGAAERCGGASSPQHTIYAFYLSFIATELLGFTTIVYSYKLLESNETKSEIGPEIQLLLGAVKNRMKDYSIAFTEVLSNVQRDIRTCDPVGKHVRDETYTEMWGLIQGILLYEYDLIYADSCSYTCINLNAERPNTACQMSKYSKTNYNHGKPEGICSTPRQCFGYLYSCHSLIGAEYCELEDNPRRYVYVKGDKGSYGRLQECNGTKGSLPVEKYWGYTCESCFCVCHDDQPDSISVHIVSLKESVSDTKNNMVVVGVRIQVHERILHLQVKQSKIIQQYKIDHGNTPWVELPSIAKDVYQAHKNPKESSNLLVRDKDFAVWDLDKSAINMDNIMTEFGRVVTGVKFEKSTKKELLPDQLELQVQTMEYDRISGKLKAGTEKWEKSSKIHEKAVQYDNLNPINSKNGTSIDSNDNMYVRFSRSDFWTDAAQTTLPLLDAQTVETQPNAPLSGVGIHHRGTQSDGGFIGLTVFSIDFAEYMKSVRESGESDFAQSTKLEEPE